MEASIAREPQVEDHWRVYADWLNAQGDPRGELIACELAPRTEALEARIAQLRRQADKARLLSLAQVDPLSAIHPPGLAPQRFGLRFGFIERFSFDPKRAPGQDLRALLEHRELRFLRRLYLDLRAPTSLSSLLGARPHLGVQTLALRAWPTPEEETALRAVFPNLQHLTITASPGSTPLSWPDLRSLTLRCLGPFSKRAHCELPALTSLDLGTAQGHDSDDAIALLLELPGLQHLRFHARRRESLAKIWQSATGDTLRRLELRLRPNLAEHLLQNHREQILQLEQLRLRLALHHTNERASIIGKCRDITKFAGKVRLKILL